MQKRQGSREKPLKAELSSIASSLISLEKTKQKYFELYELDAIERHDFTSRIEEINGQVEQLVTRREHIQAELSSLTPSEVSLQQVQQAVSRLDKILSTAPYEQRKLLLHTAVKHIELAPDRKITSVLLVFDESTQKAVKESPSDDESEGDFPLFKGRLALAI